MLPAFARVRVPLAVAAAAALVLAAIAGVALWRSHRGPHDVGGAAAFAVPPGAGPAPGLNAAAPDISLTALDGNTLRLSDLRGKTVIVNFWATWCGPCRQELPLLAELYRRNQDRGLVVLAVDVQETPDEVAAYVRGLGAPFPVVIDRDGDVVARYRLVGLPSSFFVDAQGTLKALQLGPLDSKSLAVKLREAGFQAAGVNSVH